MCAERDSNPHTRLSLIPILRITLSILNSDYNILLGNFVFVKQYALWYLSLTQ